MKYILTICISFVAIARFSSAGMNMAKPGDPRYPGKCVVEINGKEVVLSSKESYTPKDFCAKYDCENNGLYTVTKCDPKIPPANCIVVEYEDMHHNESYPECCTKLYLCADENGVPDILVM